MGIGEPKFKSKPNGEKVLFSLVGIRTSKADFNDLNKQIKDTVRYLKRNKEKLSCISSTKGIDIARLDFGIALRIDNNNILISPDILPNKLLELTADLGLSIELKIYPIKLGNKSKNSA